MAAPRNRHSMSRRRRGLRQIGVFLASVSVCWWAAAQEAPEIEQAVSLGAYAARGFYGETVETHIRYFPLTYELNRGAWGFRLTIPHLRVTGLGNVLVNVGGVTRAVAGDAVETESGLGDTVVSAIYRFEPWSSRAPFVDLRLDIKLPTANERKSLGTGEPDYSLEIDITQALGNTLLFATAGYTWRGRSELFVGLRNGAFAQLGFAYPVAAAVSAGLYYDVREPASRFSPASHELVPYFTWQINQSWSFTGLVTRGFTDASADTAVLGQLRYSW